MIKHIEVVSELFEIQGEDGPEVAECWHVSGVTKHGRRFYHERAFPSVERTYDAKEGFWYWRPVKAAAVINATKLADRVRAHLANGGKLDMARWVEVGPLYGSDAYIQFEANEIAPALDCIARGGDLSEVSPLVRSYL